MKKVNAEQTHPYTLSTKQCFEILLRASLKDLWSGPNPHENRLMDLLFDLLQKQGYAKSLHDSHIRKKYQLEDQDLEGANFQAKVYRKIAAQVGEEASREFHIHQGYIARKQDAMYIRPSCREYWYFLVLIASGLLQMELPSFLDYHFHQYENKHEFLKKLELASREHFLVSYVNGIKETLQDWLEEKRGQLPRAAIGQEERYQFFREVLEDHYIDKIHLADFLDLFSGKAIQERITFKGANHLLIQLIELSLEHGYLQMGENWPQGVKFKDSLKFIELYFQKANQDGSNIRKLDRKSLLDARNQAPKANPISEFFEQKSR